MDVAGFHNNQEGAMKVAAIGLLGLMTLAAGLSAQKISRISTGTSELFTGEITDSLCADGHHVDVFKRQKNCVLTCVRFEGAEFVLYTSGTMHEYKLDDQQLPAAYAGQEVIVTGTFDKSTNAIHVISMRLKITDAGH
jgi:hypothetical protein